MFAPPLVLDRRPLIAARMSKFRERMGRAKTVLTVERALEAIQLDRDLARKAKAELKRYGARRIDILRAWKGCGEPTGRAE